MSAQSALAETRTRARRLENEIDSKLVQLSACSSSGAAAASAGFPQLQQETESLLQQLGEVNDTMSHEAASGNSGGTATAMHMLQRHREILHDFQQEFNKSKATLKAATERSELLSSVRQDIREHRHAASRASEALLRERSAIHASGRSADEVIGQAQATRDALSTQRGSAPIVRSDRTPARPERPARAPAARSHPPGAARSSLARRLRWYGLEAARALEPGAAGGRGHHGHQPAEEARQGDPRRAHRRLRRPALHLVGLGLVTPRSPCEVSGRTTVSLSVAPASWSHRHARCHDRGAADLLYFASLAVPVALLSVRL